MTNALRQRTETDDDIDRMQESSERISPLGSLFALLGAAGILGIRYLAGTTLTVLDYLAALVIVAAVSPALLAIALRVRERERKWVKIVGRLRAARRELLERAEQSEARARELEEWHARLPPRYQLTALPARPRSGSFRSLPPSRLRRALPAPQDDQDDHEDLS